MDQSCFYIEVLCCCCCWCSLNSLSMCFEILFRFSFILFYFFKFLFYPFDIHQSRCFLTCDFYNVHAFAGSSLSDKLYRGEVYWSGPGSFLPLLCLLVTSTSCVLSLVSCAHLKKNGKVCCGFSIEKKNTLTFTVLMWDHNETYFLQRNAFWTMVLKICLF